MFQRQTKSSFPSSNILLAALAGGVLLFFVLKNLQTPPPPPAAAPATEAEKTTGGLFPEGWLSVMREYPVFKPDLAVLTAALRDAAAREQNRGGGNGLPGFSAPWQVEGPRNIGARINTVKTHPSDPNILYAGFSRGGIWKTLDGGATWKPIFDAQPFLTASDIELDPQNPNIVYVGTGDLNIGGYAGIGDGIWKSTDGGETWQHIGLENQRIVSKIILHPTQPNTIFAATMGVPFERTPERGLYKTTDGGQSWQQILYIGPETGIIDLAMAPDNPDELFATSWDRIRTNTESFVSGQNARIWKTTDGGATWAALANGLPDGKQGRIGLANTPQNPALLMAIYVDSSSQVGGIFRSTDRGATWSPTGAKPVTDWGGDIMGGFGWYFGKIFINPFDENDLFVGGVELWRSRDGGTVWEQASPPWSSYAVHADQHDLAFPAPGVFVLANDGGLYKSTDDGATWADIESIPTTQFYRVAVNPHSPLEYFGGAQDNGSTGGNADLDEWPRLWGGDGFQVAFHPTDPNIYYFETQNGGISTPNGDGTNGIEPDDRRHWDMPYFISRHDPEVMYTGTQRVYGSFGHPPNWFPVSPDLTDGVVFEPRFHVISTLDESGADADLLLVGTTDGNVWRGSPASQNWQNITAGLPERYVSSVKASPGNANRFFVAHTGYRDNDFSPHLHRSDDGGATWKPIAGNLPNLAINDILIYPESGDSVLFVGTDGGVYGTLDGGKNWARLGTGLPMVPVYDLEINPETRRLLAGTHARSLMTFPLDSLLAGPFVPTQNPGGFSDPNLVVSPSMARDFVRISMPGLPSGQAAELRVTDLGGRVLRSENLRGGESFRLEVEGISPGIYVAFARAKGQKWLCRKFVVQ